MSKAIRIELRFNVTCMLIENLSLLEGNIQPQKSSPEEVFWNASAQKYLLRQKKQKLEFYFEHLAGRVNDTELILNLASGKIKPIIDFFHPQRPLYLINIDISSLITQYNDNFLLKQHFTPRFIEHTRWWKKQHFYIRNVHGDVQALLNNSNLLNLPPKSMLLCLDGFPNLDIPVKNPLNNILKFIQLFPFSITSWLYPGPYFSFFLTKLRFYYSVVHMTHKLPLQYISSNFFTIDGNYQTLLGEEINPFSPQTIQCIEDKVDYLTTNQEIAAIKVTFFDDDPPAMKYHAFYADPSFIISLAEQHDLTVLHSPELKIRKKSSFIKTYPLVIEQRK